MTFLLILFAIVGQLGDVLTTFAGLRTGKLRELNPIAAYGYARHGVFGLLLLKTLYLLFAVTVGPFGLIVAGALGIIFTIYNMGRLREAGYFVENQ